jgi:DNA polymerase-3 subunit epsilon
MLYNVRQSYTPALEPHELGPRALIIDTETVGSGAEVEIVEVAVCDAEGRVVFDSLVRPLHGAPPRSSKEQRFEAREFDSAPDWADVWPTLSALIDNKLLIAYNAAFDRRALAAICARHGQVSTEWGWRCAMQLAKRACGMKKSLTLSEACARYGLEGGNHRAARDVLATYRLLKCLVGTES